MIAGILNSKQCTHVAPNVRAWHDGIVAGNTEVARPRAADLEVPLARNDYEGFMEVAQKKAVLLGMHCHSFTCEKGPKGLYMCRLCFARGVHSEATCPLLISMTKRPDRKAGIRAELAGLTVHDATINMIDQPYRPQEGQLVRPHPVGPLVWELHRPISDAMFVETNLTTQNLMDCATNSSSITSIESGRRLRSMRHHTW
jgi:hypothetical protein